jgi:hypothetical protein
MRVINQKFKLVLTEPGKEPKIVWTGCEKECKKKKLELSFDYNSEWLKIEEDTEEKKLTFKGVLGFMMFCGLAYLYWSKNGKKICIID